MKGSMILFLFLSWSWQVVLGQQTHYRVEQFTGQDGLSMNGILHISQDEKGFIWFRTDEGIVRYDGYSFRSFSQNPKNPNALFQKVDEIHDDAHGNIWVNYNGLGLSYLNRSTDRFRNFKANGEIEDFIGNHDVQAFHADSNYVWIGTDYGLYAFHFEDRKIDYVDLPTSVSITSLFTDNVGNLWIGTDASKDDDGIGLYILEKSSTTLYPIKGDPAEIINDIFQDSRGRIWMGTRRGLGRITNYSPGVSALSETHYELFYHDTGSKLDRSRNDISSIFESSDGNLWLSSDMGISRIIEKGNNITLRYYMDDESKLDRLGQNVIEDIRECEGTIWVLNRSPHYGLSRYVERDDAFEVRIVAKSSEKYSNYQFIDMFIDRNSVLWLGTVREGLLKMDLRQKRFRTFYPDVTNANSLPSNQIYEITEQKNGTLWIGTSNGVSRFNPKISEFKNYNTSNSNMNDNVVFSTLIDNKENLWLGHWPTQVSKIDLDTWENTPFRYIIGNDTTGFRVWTASAIEEDSEGNIWFGSHTFGLWKAIGGKRVFENYRFEKNEFDNPIAIEILFFDSNEKLWIGTSFGLYTFNKQKKSLELVTAYEDGLLFQEGIYCIVELGSDLWIGTNAGGLVQFDREQLAVVARYDKNSGLPGNTIRGILCENGQYLWLSTTSGLSRFDINTREFINYTKEDGIQGNEFNVNSYFKSSDNVFYFGGTEGLTMFRPEEITENPYPAIPQLTNLKLFNEDVVIGDTINGQVVLAKALNEIDELVLNHKNKILSIEFSSMHMTSPTKCLYKYKLEGLEEEWNLVDADRRSATYTSLPQGEYVFRVMATNNDGIWSEQEATLNIAVLPPWWNSLPFRILFLLLLVGLAIILFRLRMMSVRLQNKRLEAMVEEKTENLKEQNKEIQRMSDKLQQAAQSKIGFFMNISHEFRTPLALILGPAANLFKSPRLSATDRENVRLIERNGHRLLRLTNQLLDSADLERGILKLKVAQADVVDYVRQIVHAFDFRADSMGVNYQFAHNKDAFICWFDGDKLEKILYNLISNAFKFTVPPAEIIVDLQVSGERLRVTVSDNGIGLSEEQVEKVFDRFYQVDHKFHRRTGTGIGLNLAKQLAQKHKGDLTVTSKIGKGSSFILEIPVGEAFYEQNDHVQQQSGLTEQVEQIKMLTSNIPESELSKDRRDDSLPTILLVEDSVDMRAFMKSSLQEDYCVIQARDGIDGLKKAEELVPDIIISDIMMPAMDGIEFCDKIKENDYLSHIPIILLTAKIGEESKIEGYGVGADEYLSKPVDLNVLKARIDNLLTSRKRLRESFSSSTDLIPKNLVQDRGDEAFLKKAVKIVEDNLSDPELGYHAFVKSMGVGKTQLYNRINKISGQSINIFIRTIRLKIAANLIREGSMNFSEISYQVGFSDPNYFSKCFKKQYGMSPKAFQKINVTDS